jgi:hypothetical protein
MWTALTVEFQHGMLEKATLHQRGGDHAAGKSLSRRDKRSPNCVVASNCAWRSSTTRGGQCGSAGVTVNESLRPIGMPAAPVLVSK